MIGDALSEREVVVGPLDPFYSVEPFEIGRSFVEGVS